MTQEIYYLKFWGGATKSIEEDLGFKERDYWFNSKEERENFKQQLLPYNRKGLMIHEDEGEHTKLKTIAKMMFRYKGKNYPYEMDFGYGYPVGSAHYMFEEGNYACDCNRSLFLSREYPNFEEMDCGENIDLISFEVIQI